MFKKIIGVALASLGILTVSAATDSPLSTDSWKNYVFSHNQICRSAFRDGVFSFQVLRRKDSKDTAALSNQVQAWLLAGEGLPEGKYELKFRLSVNCAVKGRICVAAGKSVKLLSGKTIGISEKGTLPVVLIFRVAGTAVRASLRLPVVYLDAPAAGTEVSLSGIELVKLQ